MKGLALCLALCYFVLVVFQPFEHCNYLAWGRERELILVLFVCLFDLRLFGFVCFLCLLFLGRAAACDFGTLWTFLLSFLSFLSVRLYHLSSM